LGVQLIITRVQVIAKDMGAKWLTPDAICANLAICNDDLEMELQNLGLNFDTVEVILPNIPANTTNLNSFQADGQVLFPMVLCKTIEWRLAGRTQEDWEQVEQVDKVVDTDTGTGETGATVASADPTVESWEWRGGNVYLSPCQLSVDLRVRFQGLPTFLNADSPNQPFRGLVNILAYWVAQFMEESRNAGVTKLSQLFEKRLIKAKANFRSSQVQNLQGMANRLGGRRSSIPGGFPGGSGNFTPPIVN